jgi:hypothetical protein
MAAIFTEVSRDAVRTICLSQQRGLDRVWY